MLHEVEGTPPRRARRPRHSPCRLTATHAAWPAVLEGVDEVLRSCTYPTRQLTILTDLRKAGWERGVAAVARRWSEQGVRVRIVDVGDDETANVSLQALVPLDRTILAGAESRWEAADPQRLAAHARAGPRRSSASMTSRPRCALPEIPPRRAVRVPLTVPFPGRRAA